MTVDEYLDKERQMGNIISGGGLVFAIRYHVYFRNNVYWPDLSP